MVQTEQPPAGTKTAFGTTKPQFQESGAAPHVDEDGYVDALDSFDLCEAEAEKAARETETATPQPGPATVHEAPPTAERIPRASEPGNGLFARLRRVLARLFGG